MKKRSIKVCRHEAAHAVVAEEMGLRTIRARITGNGTGFTEHYAPKRPCPMSIGIVAMAGKAADRKWSRIGRKWFSHADLATVKRFGFCWRAISTLEAMAMAQVCEHSDKIERVARELKVRDLTGREIRRIMKGKS